MRAVWGDNPILPALSETVVDLFYVVFARSIPKDLLSFSGGGQWMENKTTGSDYLWLSTYRVALTEPEIWIFQMLTPGLDAILTSQERRLVVVSAIRSPVCLLHNVHSTHPPISYLLSHYIYPLMLPHVDIDGTNLICVFLLGLECPLGKIVT